MLEILTVQDIIEHLKIDRMTAYKLIREGKIKAINIGTGTKPQYRILKEDYERFLRGA